MFIKKLSHLHKTHQNRTGQSFAVLGYPRSGTTMLSEIVAMVTDYYFDRDNIFPSSSKVVLHTHWSPAKFTPAHSVYIMRNPVDVCLSVVEYSKVRGFPLPASAALSAPKICRIPWLDHVQKARSAGHHIVNYDKLTADDAHEITGLAAHLNVPPDWVQRASDLLDAKHTGQPHESDLKFKQEKAARTADSITQLRQDLETATAHEQALYSEITSRA